MKDGQLKDPDLQFIRDRRNWILKEAAEKFHQVIGNDSPDVRATTSLRWCVDATERHVREADKRLG
jgi:hypothetical protein